MCRCKNPLEELPLNLGTHHQDTNSHPHRIGRLAVRDLSVFLCMCVALLAPSSRALEIQQLWAADANMVMEGAPMVVDLNGDGDAEILTAAYENLIVLDGTGQELWRFDTRGRYSTCPAILEREGQTPLIYAADNTGMFTCLDGGGTVIWQTETAPVFCSSPALADLDGDGAIEVVQTDKSGAVSVFNALTGAVVWKRQIEGECASPAVGDLNGDGRLEIVVTTGAGKVFALGYSGERIWEFAVGGTSPDWATSSAILFGSSKGQVCVAAASRQERFFCLDGRGNLLWEAPTRGAVASTISAADFDGDGRADLFAVTQLGVLYRFDEEGRVLWDIDTQGRSLAPGAIIDVDGDGALEYVLCTQQGNLLVFNGAGEIVFNHQFDNRTINVTAAFGDIVKERRGLEFAVTGGESGRVFCFGTTAPVNAQATWRTYRCDNRLTGTWFGLAGSEATSMTPENLSWEDLLTGGAVAYRIGNPRPGSAPLRAEALCVRPDGSRQAATGRVVGKRGVLEMPMTISALGMYRFEWALMDSTGQRLASGSRELTLQPYLNDQALARRAVLALREAVGETRAPRSGQGIIATMGGESRAIEAEADTLAYLQAAVTGSSLDFREHVNARTEALNTRAERALVLAKLAPAILTSALHSQIVAFEGLTWENQDVDKQLPTDAAIPLRISRRCVAGEHEPVSIKLLNVTLAAVTIRGSVQTEPEGPAVTAYEVKPVPTNQNTVAWDPITPLGRNSVAIPSLETREVWLDIDLAGVRPGNHRITATFNTGRSETTVEIALKVLPFEMAGFGAMRLCAWAQYNGNAVRDLLAHGNNVFMTGLPPATVSDGDTPQIDVNFTDLDAFVARLTGHDVFLLMGGIPSLGVPAEDETYVPRLANYLEQVMTHLSTRGVDESHIALYPYDEPGGSGWNTVNRYVAFARQGLKARPGLKFYVNGGGDLPMFEALNEIASIWCPGYYMLPEHTPVMDYLRATGKTIWSYDCGYAYARPIGWNTKTINVAAQYRMAAVFGFNFGASGIGFWCYNYGPSMWGPVEAEFPLVYTNSDGTITSCRRWEAVRDGMEDARILIALREKLADESVSAAEKARIHHLLDVTLPSMANQSLTEVRIGAARYVLDASNNDSTVDSFRQELLDCAELVEE